jgi:hypothetical protein
LTTYHSSWLFSAVVAHGILQKIDVDACGTIVIILVFCGVRIHRPTLGWSSGDACNIMARRRMNDECICSFKLAVNRTIK